MTETECIAIGRRVGLRIVGDDDEQYLWELANHPAIAGHWTYERGRVARHRFREWLWDGTFAQFLVITKATGRRVGLAYAHRLDVRRRSVHIGYIADPAVHGLGWHLEGPGLFVDHLFREYPLRVLYAVAIDDTTVGWSKAIGETVALEGRLRDHVYVAGEYRDLLLLSITRDSSIKALSTGGPLSRRKSQRSRADADRT